MELKLGRNQLFRARTEPKKCDVGQCEPRVHTINNQKISNLPKDLIFGLRPNRKIERERGERERKQKGKLLSTIHKFSSIGSHWVKS